MIAMALAAGKNQPSVADSLRFSDPMLLFEVEDPRPLDAAPHTVGLDADDASDYRYSADPAPAVHGRRTTAGRWLTGTAVLVVGIVIGYASGLATAIWNPELRHTAVRSTAADSVALPSPARLPAHPDHATTLPDTTPGEMQAGSVRSAAVVAQPDRTSRTTASQAAAAGTSSMGVLHVESRPRGAQVLLDGQPVATTPFRLYRVTPGPHTVRIELEGYKPFTTSVTVERGTQVRVAASLEGSP